MTTITPVLPPDAQPQPQTRGAQVGLPATVASVLAAFFGVQSSRARERDFSRGSPALFFAVALALTGAFALTLFAIVRVVVLHAAGAG